MQAAHAAQQLAGLCLPTMAPGVWRRNACHLHFGVQLCRLRLQRSHIHDFRSRTTRRAARHKVLAR